MKKTTMLSLCVCVFAAAVQAATWNGGGGDNNWTTAANWGGTAPAEKDILTFAGDTRPTANNNYATDTPFNGFIFANTATAFTLTGNRVILNGNITAPGAGSVTDTISIPLVVNATRTIDLSQGSHHLHINSPISGLSGITKVGSGTLYLSGANTYAGKTAHNSGTLEINTLANIGAPASSLGAPANATDGTIELNANINYTGGNATTDRPIYVTGGGGQIRHNGFENTTLTFNGDITANGNQSFLIRGSRAVVVNGRINLGTSNFRRTDGGILTLTNSANTFGNLDILDGIIATPVLANNGQPSPIGQGPVLLLGQNNNGYPTTGRIRYTGTVDASTDRAIVLDTHSNNSSHGGIIDIADAETTATFTGNITVNGNDRSPRLQITGNGKGVLTGDIIGPIAVEKYGTSTWTLNGNNQYTRQTIAGQGILIVNSFTPAASALTVNPGATFGGTGTVHGTASILSGATLAPSIRNDIGSVLTFSNTVTLTDSQIILKLPGQTEPACDRIDIAGALTLNGNNVISLACHPDGTPAGDYILVTYASKSGGGGFTLNRTYPNATLIDEGSGTVILRVEGAGVFDHSVWVGDGSANLWNTSTANWSTGVYADNTSVVFDDTGFNDPAIHISPNAVSPFSVAFNTESKAYEITGDGITGSASLAKTGAAALTLANANTYTGPTTISGGLLTLSGSLSDTAIAVEPGASLTQTAAGVIGGAASLACKGRTILNGNNTFTGPAVFGIAGTPSLDYEINHNNALGSTAGGTTMHCGNGSIPSRLYLGGGIVITDETLTLNGANGRASLCKYSGGAATTWAGDIIAIGSAYIESNGSDMIIGAPNGNHVITNTPAATDINMRGGGTIVLNSRVAIANRTLIRNDGGTLHINSTNNTWGFVDHFEGTIRLGTDDALATSGAYTLGKTDKPGYACFNLNGHNQTLASFKDANHPPIPTGTQTVTSATAATLTITGTANTTFGLPGSTIEGPITLVKLGTGSFSLTNANSYSGSTIISNGTFGATGVGALGASTNIVVGGIGTLSLGGSAAIADDATVLMPERGVSTAKIHLTAGTDETVGWLLYGNVFKPVGTYGATGSGADHIDDTHFSGTGVLRVLYSRGGLILKVQ